MIPIEMGSERHHRENRFYAIFVSIGLEEDSKREKVLQSDAAAHTKT